jgi:hypothetical protein
MAEMLDRWTREFGDRNPFDNAARLKELQEQLPQTRNPGARITLQYELASEFLNCGRPEDTLVTLSNLDHEVRASRVSIGPNNRRQIRLLEGVAYLRLGELENCVQHHNPDSCLLPIRGGGQHSERRGSQNAEAIFSELARQKTNDLGARWLLNVAAMTLGKYPEGVPPHLRIPPRVFESEAPFPRFPELATKVGVGANELSGGSIAEDFDGDGWLDLMLSNWCPPGPCHLYRNLGNGRFEEISEKAGLTGLTGGLNTMQTDYNNDGWPDVYIVRGAWLGELGLMPDSLLKNNGDGTFADVTEEAGLLSFHPALSAAWFDANNDGWLDLFVGNETVEGQPPHPCQLFLNNRNGTFRECARAAGANLVAFVRGVTAGDFDNDGWPDLYLSCLGNPNVLLRNDGKAGTNQPPGVHFTDVTASAGVSQPALGFPTWFWDYDNDGWLDLWASGYGVDFSGFYNVNFGHASLTEFVADKLGLPSKAEKMRLYRNQRDGTFADVTREAHLDHAVLAMSANFGDLDNDGFLDFYTGTGMPYFGSLVPNEMFRNHGGKTFQNVTTAGGFGHLQKGHGISFADLNNDGQQDVVLNVGGAYPGDTFFDALFVNPGNSNRWLALKLVGRQSNRAALGARIKVVAAVKGQTREIHRVVCTGGSFGASPLRQEIGLGPADKIERVEVWWPVTGQTNTFTNLEPNRFYELTEDAPAARAISLKSFTFVSADGDGQTH